MPAFKDTDHGRKATRLVEEVAAHICEAYDVPRSKENQTAPIPSRPAEGFVPYTKGGVMATVDIPLSTFIDDYRLLDKANALPEGVRAAIRAHMDNTHRHHLEVACQGDEKAEEATKGWDWSKGLPLDALDEAGCEELVSEAYSMASVDFETETLRFTVQAMDRHEFRDALLSIVVKANTEFEYHQSEGELRRNIGPRREGVASVDHEIVDVDFTEASDLSDTAFANLLAAIKQSLPEPERPSYGMRP